MTVAMPKEAQQRKEMLMYSKLLQEAPIIGEHRAAVERSKADRQRQKEERDARNAQKDDG